VLAHPTIDLRAGDPAGELAAAYGASALRLGHSPPRIWVLIDREGNTVTSGTITEIHHYLLR